MGEDEEKSYETKVQKLTDQFIAKADELGKKKDEELMTV
jgi:ribosome recycling factor